MTWLPQPLATWRLKLPTSRVLREAQVTEVIPTTQGVLCRHFQNTPHPGSALVVPSVIPQKVSCRALLSKSTLRWHALCRVVGPAMHGSAVLVLFRACQCSSSVPLLPQNILLFWHSCDVTGTEYKVAVEMFRFGCCTWSCCSPGRITREEATKLWEQVVTSETEAGNKTKKWWVLSFNDRARVVFRLGPDWLGIRERQGQHVS
jgi:hypothetical protein